MIFQEYMLSSGDDDETVEQKAHLGGGSLFFLGLFLALLQLGDFLCRHGDGLILSGISGFVSLPLGGFLVFGGSVGFILLLFLGGGGSSGGGGGGGGGGLFFLLLFAVSVTVLFTVLGITILLLAVLLFGTILFAILGSAISMTIGVFLGLLDGLGDLLGGRAVRNKP